MREIKAYVRPGRVDAVVQALEGSGVRNLTVSHVRSIGSGVDPKHFGISFETGTTYTEVAKLELVCAESEADALVDRIRGAAHTGEQGDGLVFVTPVVRAVRIRTGEEGRAALR